MSVITNLLPTTELEAINAMLSAIGESPVADLTGTEADVVTAISTLRNTARQVQAMGWRFNTEFGYELPPFAQMAWIDTAGITTTLNIFKPPVNCIRAVLTVTSEQSDLDMVVRPSRLYTEGAPLAPALVFYDRSLNRDGLDSTKFPYLYINPVWLFDFEQMPEEARCFAFVRAARVFIQERLGSDALARFKDLDEKLAYRNLKIAHGQDDDYNMLTGNVTVLRVLGGRNI